MQRYISSKPAIISLATALMVLGMFGQAYADTTTPGVSSVEAFIKSVITLIAGMGGLIATGFFVAGGFRYITSTGSPQHLDQAKRTIIYSAVGLSIIIAAFVLSNIVTSLATNAFGS